MATKLTQLDLSSGNEIGDLLRSFERSCRSMNLSSETIRSYVTAVELFERFLCDRRCPTVVSDVRGEHVELFIIDQLERWKPKTARIRYGNLQQFFAWCVKEDEIPQSPMRNLEAPSVPESPVPLVRDDQLKELFKICEGTSFEQRRDHAILRTLYGCGLRRGEVAGLRVEDLDWHLEVFIVTGKGRRVRSVPFGVKTGQAIDRYLRVRTRHPLAASPMLWVGEKGLLTGSGIAQMLRRRCKDAGIPLLHPHQFRHTQVHDSLKSGMSETDAMRIFGWKSRQMLSRYGAAAADERARDAARRIGMGDRI